MVGEMAVGDGDGSRSHDRVDEPVVALGHGDVVDPDVAGPEDGDPVAIAHRPQTNVICRISDQSPGPFYDIVDPYPVDDDIAYELQRDPGTAGDEDIGSPTVDSLVAGHDELLVEPYDHAPGEGDPEWPVLGDCVPQRPGYRVNHVVIRGIGYDVVLPGLTAPGCPAKPEHAIGQLLPVGLPVGVAPPAPVNRVGGKAWSLVLIQSPPCAVAAPYSPFAYIIEQREESINSSYGWQVIFLSIHLK